MARVEASLLIIDVLPPAMTHSGPVRSRRGVTSIPPSRSDAISSCLTSLCNPACGGRRSLASRAGRWLISNPKMPACGGLPSRGASSLVANGRARIATWTAARRFVLVTSHGRPPKDREARALGGGRIIRSASPTTVAAFATGSAAAMRMTTGAVPVTDWRPQRRRRLWTRLTGSEAGRTAAELQGAAHVQVRVNSVLMSPAQVRDPLA